MVCINGRLIGDEKELARWAHEVWEFTLHRPHALNLALAEDYYSNYLRDTEASNTHMQKNTIRDYVKTACLDPGVKSLKFICTFVKNNSCVT